MKYLVIMILSIFGLSDLAYGQVSAASSISQGRTNIGKKNENKWSASAQSSFSQSRDYYSDMFTTLSAGVAYKVSEKTTAYSEFGYSQPMTKDQETVERYGFDDMDFGLNFSNLYTNRYNFTIGATTAITLPTSRASREASLIAGWSGGLITSTPLQFGFRVSSSHLLIANWYTYKTSDVSGYDYNFPFGISNSLAARWSHKDFYISSSFGLTNIRDYSNADHAIQSARAAIGYNFPHQISAEIYGRWRDKVISNYSAFDDDKTVTGILLTVAL